MENSGKHIIFSYHGTKMIQRFINPESAKTV